MQLYMPPAPLLLSPHKGLHTSGLVYLSYQIELTLAPMQLYMPQAPLRLSPQKGLHTSGLVYFSYQIELHPLLAKP
jgi:hypothetical protein